EEDADIKITACREVKEEVGIDITPAGLVLLRDILTNSRAGPVYHMKTFAYHAAGEFRTQLNCAEVDEEVWMTAREALEKLYLPYQVSAAIYTISRFANVAELFRALEAGHINDNYKLHKDYWL